MQQQVHGASLLSARLFHCRISMVGPNANGLGWLRGCLSLHARLVFPGLLEETAAGCKTQHSIPRLHGWQYLQLGVWYIITDEADDKIEVSRKRTRRTLCSTVVAMLMSSPWVVEIEPSTGFITGVACMGVLQIRRSGGIGRESEVSCLSSEASGTGDIQMGIALGWGCC